MKFALLTFVFCLNGRQVLASTLTGMWAQDCRNRVFRTEEFSAGDVIYQEIYAADDRCANTLLRFRMTGPFRIAGSDIDFLSYKYEAVVTDQTLAQSFNRRRVCGWNDWTLGQARDVAGQACDFFNWGSPVHVPPAGTWRFGRWKIENGLLFFGQLTPDRDGSTPLRRPSAWNPSFYRKMN